MEKMPSASNSPIVGRKNSSEDVNSKKGQPLSVASMVRRFERDTGLGDAKNRGGEQLERSNSSLNKSDSQKLIIDRSCSRNSSLNSSQADIPAAVNIEAVASTEAVETEDKPIQSPKASTTIAAPAEQSSEKTEAEPSAKPNKTVRNFYIFISALLEGE